MKLRFVAVMIAIDLALHANEFLTGNAWPIFPSRESYTFFWAAYWGIALIVLLDYMRGRK